MSHLPPRAVFRLATAVLPLFVLLAPAQAQGGLGILTVDGIEIPDGPWFVGESGNDNLVGTDQADTLEDPSPNDQDSLHDSPGTPGDGEPDDMSTFDGDDNDSMWGGPEDTFHGDPGDKIFIFFPGETSPGWSGTYADYLRLRAFLRWLRDQFQHYVIDLSSEGIDEEHDEWEERWKDKFVETSGKLDRLPSPLEPDDSGTFRFPEVFSIGPYVVGEVPASPQNVLRWMPFDEPLLSPLVTAEVEYTSQQFTKTVAAAQNILQYLKTSLAE